MPEFGFGLDVGAANIKLACIKRVKKELQLVDLVLQKGIEPAPIKGEIERILSENKLKEGEVVTSVSGPSVVVRYVDFPDMSEGEVKNAIALESERFLPFRFEDVNLDVQVLKGASESKGKMHVLIVAARKEIIKKRLDFLDSAGLIPIAIDVDALSLANCFEKETVTSTNAIGLLNIGATFTNLCIIEEGIPCFTRDIPLGGNTISSHLQKRLGILPEEAEDLKIKIGLSQEGEEAEKEKITKINDAVKEILESFLKEVRYSFDFHQSQAKGKVIERIYLSGGTSLLKEVDKFLGAELGVSVEIWNPLKLLPAPKELIDKWQAMSSMFPVSLGLAYKGLEYA
ncbi:hypothetical protein AUJ66_07795 [Candidatus Desantisbacteria bacterium CG1_02_38_46]|uniref:SHS2 domain-containing protein n=1 Tax=Candidatus Desantisbacteria bacterium CG1_02_38_46 TaxID=1817893 RepID=A0A1J4S967_9BACT|nr:MAG: hypothetical protein AUJ66_07795 [Candidatus Desantisbacteria bacterium CG1_02_38_46]